MQTASAVFQTLLCKDWIDVLIRVGLIASVVVFGVHLFAPFMGLALWALILAVAACPLQQRLAKRLGGRHTISSPAIR
jgi:predicted PurR-regulated permease PerM